MSQMCPNCSHDNSDDSRSCASCGVPLRGLLGENAVLNERYQVKSVLGCGAMGAVYLADDQRLDGRRTAIKQNRPDANATVEVRAQSRDQFLAEASVLARLDHPNLPKVSDFFIETDNEFLVMDYVEGEDLESLLQRNQAPLVEKDVVVWLDQALDALDYLHTHGEKPIIHRDIKPANFRLNLQQNRVKLVDFGLVKLYDEENPETKVELRGIGTPAYAPLEQFASSERHTDPRSDLYALGATAYHLLTNLYPPDVHQRLLDPKSLTPPRELNSSISEHTERVILRALEIYPDDRYQSAAKMREALSGKNQTSALPAAGATGDAPWGPLLFGALGAAIVLLILAGVSYWVFFQGGGVVESTPTTAVAVTQDEPTATATSIVVEGFSDAPTDEPTVTPEPTNTPTRVSATATPEAEPTEEEPTPTPTTETPTPAPVAAPSSRRIPASTLTGVIAYPVYSGSYSIYLGQVDGSGNEFFKAQASQPAFSPDGSRIAYHSWALDARGLINADRSGNNPVIVATFIEDQLPTWSSDGSELVLLSRREGDRGSRLYKVNAFQERGQGIVLGEGEYPTIGQNGQLVFRGWSATGNGLRIATDTMEGINVLTNSDDDTAPALSPDGSQVVFMSRRTGNWEIFIANVDGSEPVQLTENAAEDGLPTWSPDGRAIAFVSSRDGGWAVWAMTPTGDDLQQLFPMEGSPDGQVGSDTFASRGWLEERISWTQ